MHRGELGTEIAPAPAVGADPAAREVAERVDELLRRACDLEPALAHAKQAALKLVLPAIGKLSRMPAREN
jgi:hypothetical protein